MYYRFQIQISHNDCYLILLQYEIFHFKEVDGNNTTVWKGICIEMLDMLKELLQFR